MAQLAIKGHPTRGKEIIEILEMLGGMNKYQIGTIRQNYVYFIDMDNIIRLLQIAQLLPEKDIIYSLEEFLEKYPYKVGDKVILDEIPCTIIWMCWECNNIYYQVQGVNDIFTKKVTAEKLKPYKEETMEGKDMSEHTSEINLNHPCFNGHDKIELIIPDNWKFEQRGNKMFGIRKYPQYPKTYEECCDILGFKNRNKTEQQFLNSCDLYDAELMTKLSMLKVCRDAYWKIAGEQMGLGKHWRPDWKDDSDKHFICYLKDELWMSNIRECNRFLVFPTKEMRDEFYNNFKDFINEVKELL